MDRKEAARVVKPQAIGDADGLRIVAIMSVNEQFNAVLPSR
jgi:hypothetical protein